MKAVFALQKAESLTTIFGNSYTYNKETNFDQILLSAADMAGIQQMIDQYLAADTYLDY